MTADERSVQAHYRTEGLLDRILAGLRAAGMDPEAPTVDDLAPADEFHSLGRVATKDLAELAALKPGTRVLDVGSGLGGPARFLATTYSCDVTGIDLMPEFCTVATELSRLTRLTERTRFRQGNALALPFDEGTFRLRVDDSDTDEHCCEAPILRRNHARPATPAGNSYSKTSVRAMGSRWIFPFPGRAKRGRAT